ncbi:MAG: multicopper oxidase family protein [Hyphomicrobiaceae bacterium]
MTRVSRRTFINGAGALAGLAWLPRTVVAGAAKPIELTAKPGMAQLLDAGEPKTAVWGYDGSIPGPLLRVRQNDEVWVRLKNELDQPTTIHWHGIRIDNRMDGVAGLTQEPVAPGATFDYRFRVPDAGSFWYHPHNRSWEQVARGLYGALIVDERDPPRVDRDLVLIIDDWRLQNDGAIHTESFGSLRDISHGGRLGNVISVNGQPYGNVDVKANERLRLRLMNTCNARILDLKLEGLSPYLIAVDGQAVAVSQIDDGKLTLAPGQRADLIVDMRGKPGDRLAVNEVSRDPLTIGHFVLHPTEPFRDQPLAAPANLPRPAIKEPDLASAQSVDLVMTGGAMSGIEGAMYKGVYLPIRELIRKHGKVWAFNGVVGRSDEPLFRVAKDRSVKLKMVNKTPWPHAMHVHGHHFKVIERNDGRPLDATWRDTVLMDPDSTFTIAFLADNPGKWMLHCHMLEHQAGGMATWFEIVA